MSNVFCFYIWQVPKNIENYRKDQILTAKWHDSKYVQLLAIWHSRLENKKVTKYVQ